METISTSQALQIAGRAGRSLSFSLLLSLFQGGALGITKYLFLPNHCFKPVSSVTSPRFSSKFKEGEVTTMHKDDLPVLTEILSHSVDPIEVIIYTQSHTRR